MGTPNGILATPRLLSNVSDAPFLGEAAILWLLSIQPQPGLQLKAGSVTPAYFYIVAISMLLVGTWLVLQALWKFHHARRGPMPVVLMAQFQIGAWLCLSLSSAVMFWLGHGLIGMALMVAAVILPMVKRQKAPKGTEDWPSTPASAAPAGKNPQATNLE